MNIHRPLQPTFAELVHGLPVMPPGIDTVTALLAETSPSTLAQAANEVINAEHELRQRPNRVDQHADSTAMMYQGILPSDTAKAFGRDIAEQVLPRHQMIGSRAITDPSTIAGPAELARRVSKERARLSRPMRLLTAGMCTLAFGGGAAVLIHESQTSSIASAVKLVKAENAKTPTHTEPLPSANMQAGDYAGLAVLSGFIGMGGGVAGAMVGNSLSGRFARRKAKQRVQKARLR